MMYSSKKVYVSKLHLLIFMGFPYLHLSLLFSWGWGNKTLNTEHWWSSWRFSGTKGRPILPSDLGCWLGEPSFRHSQRGDFQLIAGATLSKPKETQGAPRSTWREHQPTATQKLIVEHVPAGFKFQCTKINMVAYGCHVSPAWVSTEHVTHGSSAASNSAPHLPLFDLEVPDTNPTITHQSTVSSHPHPHQNSTWRSHRDDTRSAVGDVSPMLMTRSCYLTLGFAGFVPSPRPTPQKLDPKWVPERAKHSGRKIWHEMKGPWRLSPIEHNPKITNLFSRRAFLVTPRWWRSTWRFPITDHSWNVDIHARKSKRGRRANQVKSNNSRQISQVK